MGAFELIIVATVALAVLAFGPEPNWSTLRDFAREDPDTAKFVLFTVLTAAILAAWLASVGSMPS